jgi:hypothetical protein
VFAVYTSKKSSSAWFLLGAVAALGCGGRKMAVDPRPAQSFSYHLPSTSTAKGTADPREPFPLASSFLTAVPERTLGPFFARREGASMIGYVVTEGGTRKVAVVPLDESGKPRTPLAEVKGVASPTGDVETMVIRATGGARAGFVSAWTSQTDRGEAIELVGITDEGAPRGQPVEVARTLEDIVWLEIVPTPRGAVCIWAEETRDQTANVVAVALDPDGRPRGVPSPIAKGVRGWQAVPTVMGIGLAMVTQSKDAKALPSLMWTKLDADARAIGAPVAITSKASVGADIDVARAGNSWVFAWTDRSGFDPQVMVAAIDDGGTVRPPAPAVTPVGGATLVGLAAAGDGAALAWDESGHAHGSAGTLLRLHVGKLNASAKLSADMQRTFDLQGDSDPALVTAGRGVALVASAHACLGEGAACGQAPVLPMVIRLDDKFAPASVEAVKLRDRRAAKLAWGLDCSREPCVLLAAAGNDKGQSEVHSAILPSRASAYRVPLTPPIPPDAPRPAMLETVAAREPFTDLAAARAGDATLVALVSSGAVESDPKKKKPGDTITLRELDASGKTRGEPTTITNRALAVGGVAVAVGPSPDDGAVVVWVAREGTDPQVHLTRVDRHGKKIRDQLVTTDKGDASDVAVAWAGNGWLVAWVDGKDGNGEVYTARVSPDLRVAAHERISNGPGDASDLSLLVRGDRAWLAYADPRESPHDGFSDIYVAQVRTSDGKKVDESRVLATAAHSRSPVLTGTDDGVAIGWIEEAPMGTEPANSAAYGAMLSMLDIKGKMVGEPLRTGGMGPGFPTSLVFFPVEGKSKSVRAILARASRDALSLDALEWRTGEAPRVFPLLGLSGPPSLDVSLAVAAGALFYNDGAPEEERVRRLALGWK